jgi:hypothetical protein
MIEIAHQVAEHESSGSQPSRRGFLAATGGSAAALAAASLIGSAEAADAVVGTTDRLAVGDGPFVAYVESVKSGKVTVFAGAGATSFTNKTIVSSIARKAGE